MLLSPGHSPRPLSDQSPAPQNSNSNPNNPNPDPGPTCNATVLDEDTYVSAIEKIIERDFFPDLPKLRDRLDWLEALRSHDPLLIRDAQLKILDRRRSRSRSLSLSRPPTDPRTLSPLSNFPSPSPSLAHDAADIDPHIAPDAPDDSLSLDQFLRRYTSQDNHSFSKIIERVNRKRKERFAHLIEPHAAENNPNSPKRIETDPRDRITDGYGTSGQPPHTLDSWNYTAKNALMYTAHDEAPLTVAEREERLKGLTKEIARSNTRFHGNASSADDRPKEEDAVAILYAPVAGATPGAVGFAEREAERAKKYDLEELRRTPNPFYVESGKKAENGYGFVRTPSPAPGIDESPFITWGEIEGTPLRLEPEDTPVGIGGSGEGPHFSIPCPPSRDVKAHELSREASRKLRERSKMLQKPPLPSPARAGSMSPSIRTLSSAAQKFVRNAMAKSSNSVDESLRASYRSASPSVGTPKVGRSLSRYGTDGSFALRSPSVREGSNPP